LRSLRRFNVVFEATPSTKRSVLKKAVTCPTKTGIEPASIPNCHIYIDTPYVSSSGVHVRSMCQDARMTDVLRKASFCGYVVKMRRPSRALTHASLVNELHVRGRHVTLSIRQRIEVMNVVSCGRSDTGTMEKTDGCRNAVRKL
jgi:hypothetical protein